MAAMVPLRPPRCWKNSRNRPLWASTRLSLACKMSTISSRLICWQMRLSRQLGRYRWPEDNYMRLGLEISNFTWSERPGQLGNTFGLLVERAEQAGFYSLWVMDHFFQLQEIGPVEGEMLEAWSALAFAAGRTNRIKLGTLVTGVTYRHPGILVKTASTLDVLSAWTGLFGGWCGLARGRASMARNPFPIDGGKI